MSADHGPDRAAAGTAEGARLAEIGKSGGRWRHWGPYLSDRQWGTVREDYSPYGNAWEYLPHDHARSRAYRWGEDGIGGFGDYTETGQVIPVRFRTPDGAVQLGGYVHAMYLDDNAPIAGGREIWGFPKKLASPKISHESETVVCTLHYGSVLCVCATMGYKHREIDSAPLRQALARPSFMIKIIPHVDCTPRICELVRYYLEDVTVKGAWSGPAAIQLFEHAMCDVARLPVREVVGASHYVTDLTLGLVRDPPTSQSPVGRPKQAITPLLCHQPFYGEIPHASLR